MLRDTEKERKRVGIALEDYNPLMKAILFAFQDSEVIKAVAEITGLQGLEADESLYGSGISMMLEGDFLMPHLDNSHDGDGNKYRVINTLYYISPDWPEDKGGNLELWDKTMHERLELHHSLTQGTESFAEALSYFPEASAYRLTPELYLEHIRKAKASLSIPVIASLNGVSTGPGYMLSEPESDWIKYAALMEKAGADALELNLYYVPTDPDLGRPTH